MEVGVKLTVNFANFVSQYQVDNGIIIHWQSKPVGYREWGLYDVAKNEYISTPHFAIAPGLSAYGLELDDFGGYVPSAVLYYPNASVVVDENGLVSVAPVTAPTPEYQI